MLRLASRIATAYLRANPLSVEEIPALVSGIHAALVSAVGPAPAAEPQAMVPAVPIKKSVRHDSVVCLVCGKPGRSLKRHLDAAHGMTPVQYREAFGLPADYPMVAPAYAERRSELAKQSGLGRKAKSDVSSAQDAKGFQYPASRWSKPSA